MIMIKFEDDQERNDYEFTLRQFINNSVTQLPSNQVRRLFNKLYRISNDIHKMNERSCNGESKASDDMLYKLYVKEIDKIGLKTGITIKLAPDVLCGAGLYFEAKHSKYYI